MKQNKKNQKGFTLIELIIVIAIMGILAAVLVPSFTKMTTKAKVSTDLRSVQTLQKQLDLYATEHGGYVGSDGTTPLTVTTAVQALIDGQYIEQKATSGTEGEKVGLQSGATLVLLKLDNSAADGGEAKFKLQSINVPTTTTQKILNQLSTGTDKDLIYVPTT
ncbi:MAG: type II secretion system protein [Cellulosilyticaceae bacterium]